MATTYTCGLSTRLRRSSTVNGPSPECSSARQATAGMGRRNHAIAGAPRVPPYPREQAGQQLGSGYPAERTRRAGSRSAGRSEPAHRDGRVLVLTVDAGAEDRFRDLLADVSKLKRALRLRHPQRAARIADDVEVPASGNPRRTGRRGEEPCPGAPAYEPGGLLLSGHQAPASAGARSTSPLS